jgi:hypothetical protein
MKNSGPNQVDAESIMSEFGKVLAGQKDRLFDWHEEVSHISTNPCPNAYKFTLYAFGTGDPQILTIVEDGLPEVRLDIPIDRDGIEKLAHWFLESVGLLDQLREKKNQEVDDAIKKSKRARVDTEKLRDWKEDISRIKIYSWHSKCKFKLHAYGNDMQSEFLTISLHSDSERKMEEVCIERNDIELVANWLIDCLFLLDWLRKRKEVEITDALRTRRTLMLRYEHKFVPGVDCGRCPGDLAHAR